MPFLRLIKEVLFAFFAAKIVLQLFPARHRHSNSRHFHLWYIDLGIGKIFRDLLVVLFGNLARRLPRWSLLFLYPVLRSLSPGLANSHKINSWHTQAKEQLRRDCRRRRVPYRAMQNVTGEEAVETQMM